MRINLRQIEVFRAVMANGSISGAAQALYVSQPAVSRLIAYTEQRLGFPLFKRIRGRLYPTPEAKRLYSEINFMYQGIQRVNQIAENLAQNKEGALSIACSPNLGQTIFPPVIAEYKKNYPHVRVKLQTLFPSTMSQALLTNQVCLGISDLSTDHPNLVSEALFSNRVMVAVPKNHPLATKNCIDVEDLKNENLIGYHQDSAFSQLLERHLKDLHNSEPQLIVQQPHIACALVQTGIGIALVDEATTFGPIWTEVVTIPLSSHIESLVSLYYMEFEPLSQIATLFIDTFKQYIETKNLHHSIFTSKKS